MNCPKCFSEEYVKSGYTRGLQRYKCKGCGCNFTQSQKRGATLELRLQALKLYLEVLGFSVGSRGRKAFNALVQKIKGYSVGHYASDDWKIYRSLPTQKHLVGKKHTTQIESLNANVRHYLARFRRRTRCYSKSPLMVKLSLVLLFHKSCISILF